MESEIPKVSVVIGNLKGLQHIEGCLKSLLNTRYPNLEVIVVDCLTSGINSWIRESFPQVKLIHYDYDIGSPAARNVGFKASSGNYVAFVDNDTEMDPNWLEQPINVMEHDPTVGAMQSKLLSMELRNHFDCAGAFIDYYGVDQKRGGEEEDRGQYDKVDEIFYAKGAAMIVRREVLDKVGVFDPTFWIFSDETDLCWRIWLVGYRVLFAFSSKVYHKMSGTRKSEAYRASSSYYLTRNKITTMMKNYSFKNLVQYVPAHVILGIGTAIRSIHLHEKNIAFAVVRAILWNLANLKSVWKRHLEVQHVLRKVSDEYLMERVIKKPAYPSALVLLNLLPFGRRLLKLYKHS